MGNTLLSRFVAILTTLLYISSLIGLSRLKPTLTRPGRTKYALLASGLVASLSWAASLYLGLPEWLALFGVALCNNIFLILGQYFWIGDKTFWAWLSGGALYLCAVLVSSLAWPFLAAPISALGFALSVGFNIWWAWNATHKAEMLRRDQAYYWLLAAILFLLADSLFLLELHVTAALFLTGACLLASGVLGIRQLQIPLIHRLLPISNKYDPNQVMREFSLGISNITSPNLLATVAIGLISEALEIQRGYLFEVDFEAHPTQSKFRLHGVGGMGQIPAEMENITLPADSPFTSYLRARRQPVYLLEITAAPEFISAPAEVRTWVTTSEMEVFAPIMTKEDWIGLVALGPKRSGAVYLPADMLMLGTLADQLSLALQHARLIDSLLRVNNDFRRAYAAMEQSNRQLQQAITQLERMDATKTDFISVASHELRTPLTVIRGYTEMFMEDPALKSNPIQNKMMTGIHNGIMRLNEIVESMLDVASIDARSLTLHKQPVAINSVFNSLKVNLGAALEERKINLIFENLRNLPKVQADSELITKAFSQLINNAIKYTPDGGSVTVSGVIVSEGQLNLPQGGIEVVVSDTGIGIDPANLGFIFEKFSQTGKVSLHSTGKFKFKGSGPGLGLAIAKGIIVAHEGKIWAESKAHDETNFPGSQFHVVLPLGTESTQ